MQCLTSFDCVLGEKTTNIKQSATIIADDRDIFAVTQYAMHEIQGIMHH